MADNNDNNSSSNKNNDEVVASSSAGRGGRGRGRGGRIRGGGGGRYNSRGGSSSRGGRHDGRCGGGRGGRNSGRASNKHQSHHRGNDKSTTRSQSPKPPRKEKVESIATGSNDRQQQQVESAPSSSTTGQEKPPPPQKQQPSDNKKNDNVSNNSQSQQGRGRGRDSVSRGRGQNKSTSRGRGRSQGRIGRGRGRSQDGFKGRGRSSNYRGGRGRNQRGRGRGGGRGRFSSSSALNSSSDYGGGDGGDNDGDFHDDDVQDDDNDNYYDEDEHDAADDDDVDGYDENENENVEDGAGDETTMAKSKSMVSKVSSTQGSSENPDEALHCDQQEKIEASAQVVSPPAPTVVLKGGTNGVPMLLSRGAIGGMEQQQQHLLAAAAVTTAEKKDSKKKKKGVTQHKKKKKKDKQHPHKNKGTHEKGEDGPDDDDDDDDDEWEDYNDGDDGDDEESQQDDQDAALQQQFSATEALEKLPAQEVSITASTQVTLRTGSAMEGNTGNSNDDNKRDQSNSVVPMLLTRNVATAGKPPTAATSKKKKKKKNSKALSLDDPKANEKAARKFNNAVRLCLEAGDPVAMRELLRHKKNAHFCLEATVLETVMKAYVMAALFEDALYCLRNCALPATLDVQQTERILQCLPQNLRNSSAYTAADMINALCVTTDFGHDAQAKQRRTWFLRIVRGISLEFLEEATSARDRICSASCERLVRSGLCVVDAKLKRGKKISELIVIPGDQLGCFVSENDQRGIATGDAVSILPYAGPYPLSAESLDRNMIEATVTNTNPMVLRLQDKLNANLYAMLTSPEEGNVYRIDKLANRMGFNRQLTAAVAITTPSISSEDNNNIKMRDTRRPCPQLIKAITAMDENIDLVMRQSAKGALPRGELTSTAALCAQPIPWSVEDEYNGEQDEDTIRSCARLALEKYSHLEGLNASQRLAVEGAITNRLTLIQGPPGTGKTMVAIKILQQWARLAEASAKNNENPAPILATSDSNIAVDNLVEGCASIGLRVVRLGRPEAIRPELLRYCIDRPSPPSSYDDKQKQPNEKYGSSYNSSSYYQGTPSSSAPAISHKERMKQLKSAQIVCCTCIGSGGDMLDALGPLERVLVDEATQATEPAVIVPLMRGCRQLVLVGDHCQLPPTVLSTTAEEEGHGVPLFSRMVACGVPPFMLDTQYRMHPYIAMFPSDLFYGGLLRNGVSAPERRPLAGFPWPREEFPVAFVPVKGDEMDDGVSKYNEAEAAAACDAVAALLQGGQCTVSDIAVVTPYAAQARLIRRLVKRLTPNSGPPYIEVSSVDGFQGREKNAVIFSAVRSNDYGAIGFTSDWRRVNVSFTRARRALIVIGNDQTLRRGDPETWALWLAWADAHGINMDKPGIPRGRYDPEQMRRVRGGTTAAEMLKDVLERQQAQLKSAEKQQERAEQNTRGHITGGSGGVTGTSSGNVSEQDNDAKPLTLEEDLALMENIDGNWDDSEDEGAGDLPHSVSRTTLASATSSNDLRGDDSSNDNAVDIWDL